jgi:hypothetical protein
MVVFALIVWISCTNPNPFIQDDQIDREEQGPHWDHLVVERRKLRRLVRDEEGRRASGLNAVQASRLLVR